MSRVYRLLRAAFAASPLDGEGSYRFGGRWSSPGTRLLYTAENLSLAMLEYLAHLDPSNWPDDLMFTVAEIPNEISRIYLKIEELPANWKAYPAPTNLSQIGDQFVSEAKAAILCIPSVLAPTESNWLINPLHPEFLGVKVISTEQFQYDQRLRPSSHSSIIGF
ncbi:MAG: RES family NAD+ phosphorylase [Terracidiphilus sp.]